MPVILDALGLSEADPVVGRLVAAFGGDPVEVTERRVGEPAYLSRRLKFTAGGEIILQDDTVVQVLLHLTPTPVVPHGIDLSEWLARVTNDATLDTLKKVFAAHPRYMRPDEWYFTLDGGNVAFRFAKGREPKDPKTLESVAFVVRKSGFVPRPLADDCPVCRDILVRGDGVDGAVDVVGTVAALTAAISAGFLEEDPHWVAVDNLRLLHASRLMERVESQTACTACRRIICLTLFRDAPATFGYYGNDAMRRPLEVIPPVQLWGDEEKIAEDRNAMHYVDHGVGSWFLVEWQGSLYLDARYSVSVTDFSALIALTDAETEAYRNGGRDYISSLAGQINNDGPHREESPYHERDLYRSSDRKSFREAVSKATINHTWMARQRQAAIPPTPTTSRPAAQASDTA